MSDNYTDDDFSSDEELDADEQSPRGLRRAANKAKKLEQELAKLQRELAFSRAGIPMDDPKMNYFIKGYDGEMTAEAIRAAALEAGFLGSQQPNAAEEAQLHADAAAQQRVMSASAGASQDAMTEEAVLSQMQQALEEGGVEAFLDVARSFGMPTSIEQ